MLKFSCEACGALIHVEDTQRDRPTVCKNCNTRQSVPADAMPAFQPDPATSPVAPPKVEPPKPPEYEAVTIIGIFFIALAICLAVFVVVVSCLHPPESLIGLVGLASPLMLVAFVLVMFMIRDIAIHTWHIRRRPTR